MSIFDGLGTVDATTARSPWLTPGKYLVEIAACRGGKNKKKKPYFAVDFHVWSVLQPYHATEDEGDVAATLYENATAKPGKPLGGTTWYINLGGDWPELALGNIKAFLAAAVAEAKGGDPDDYIDMIDGSAADDAIDGEGKKLAGLFLIANAENRTTKSGRPFTVTTYTPGGDAAVEAGIIEAD